MSKMPDFLIIGAPKSGTTSLYFYLQQHPNIYMPFKKEPFFFTLDGQELTSFHFEGKLSSVRKAVIDIDEYQNLFKDAPKDALIGEASTIYLYDPQTPVRIQQYIPNAKLIAVLRNPVDRAYSHYLHFRRDQLEPLTDFMQAVDAEKERMEQNWFMSYFYTNVGFYSRQIKHYYQYFPKEQLKIFLFEDLQDSTSVVKQIFQFLELDSNILVDTRAKHNKSGIVRFPLLYQMIKNSNRIKPLLRKMVPINTWGNIRGNWEKLLVKDSEPMPIAIRDYLINLYHDDIIELQSILQRDLSHWLEN